MTEEEVVEKVVAKLQGNKRFKYYASETVYYEIEIEAPDRDSADEIYFEADIGKHVSDYGNFETNDVIEEEL